MFLNPFLFNHDFIDRRKQRPFVYRLVKRGWNAFLLSLFTNSFCQTVLFYTFFGFEFIIYIITLVFFLTLNSRFVRRFCIYIWATEELLIFGLISFTYWWKLDIWMLNNIFILTVFEPYVFLYLINLFYELKRYLFVLLKYSCIRKNDKYLLSVKLVSLSIKLFQDLFHDWFFHLFPLQRMISNQFLNSKLKVLKAFHSLTRICFLKFILFWFLLPVKLEKFIQSRLLFIKIEWHQYFYGFMILFFSFYKFV